MFRNDLNKAQTHSIRIKVIIAGHNKESVILHKLQCGVSSPGM